MKKTLLPLGRPGLATNYESIREEKVKVFRMIRPLGPEDVVREQFRGYRREAGVASSSTAETLAAARLWIDSPRWKGRPSFVRAGKCLSAAVTEVLVTLKPPTLSNLCPGQANYVHFQLSPDVTITIGALVKRSGEQLIGEPVETESSQSSARG